LNLNFLSFVIPKHGFCARNLLFWDGATKLSGISRFLLFATLIVRMTKEGVY